MAPKSVLLPHHLEQLMQGSGIAPEVIAARGYRSIHGPEGYGELKRLGFSRPQAKQIPGLLIPILGLDGQPVLYQYRPDSPRIDAKGKAIKYETPRGAAMRLDFATGQAALIGDPTVPKWLTEGPKKLDALRSHNLCAIGMLGVWNWRGRNLDGGKVALADWERVALNNCDVYLCFDSDVTTNAHVRSALTRLKRFLAQRGARVHVVLLPAEPGQKVGVDDYLLGHTLGDLQALVNGHPSDKETVTTINPYRISAQGGLVWLKPTRDGDIPTPLTNFNATIVGDIITDDGAETTRQFQLEAWINGRMHRFTVAAALFPSLGWVSEHLGAQALLYPGQAMKDHARAAIQCLSDVIVERRIFRHTGWRRNHEGEWSYFHGGGVLGQGGQVPNMEVLLPAGLERLVLPHPPTGHALHQAIHASLSVLDVAQDPVSVPLWAASWRAVLSSADFGGHVTGPTGTGKTELATLVQQHFGAAFDARHLPGSWLSTGNSLEDLAFTAKDAVLVIDDFAPGGTIADIARTHREADRVLRAQGNQAGRQRMRADGTLRPAKPPRGLILSTGEEIPRGQSLRARVIIIEVSPADVDWARLAGCQREAANGLYAQAMAGFIRWLAPRYEQIREAMPRDIAELQAKARRDGQHRRAVANVASLAVGIRHWLRFAQEAGALTSVEAESLWLRCWTALLRVCEHQQRYQDTSEPTQHFLRLLSAVLVSGRAHLAGPDGGEPESPQGYGWRQVTTGAGPYITRAWHPQGRRIGWADGHDLYLEPEAAFAEAQLLATQQGEAVSVSPHTLRKRLHERRLLVSTGKEAEGRETLLVRRTLEERRRDVLHLHAQSLALYTPQKPDQPDQKNEAGQEARASSVKNLTNGAGLVRSTDHDIVNNINGLSYDGQVGQVVKTYDSQDAETRKTHALEEGTRSADGENLTTKPDHKGHAYEDI
jgi:hypothetical protein